jgi:orotidine-5'-phosphate decarboxylase
MTKQDIFEQIKAKRSYLCVGLDTDINKIPGELRKLEDPVFEFNKRIIDGTHDLCISYKLNLAFYETLGPKGLDSLQKTVDYIPEDIFLIADAKRGDIGNTSNMYASAFFEYYNFDAVTLSPYMGKDSVDPYLKYQGKWAILLALTSNKGSQDFQTLKTERRYLYEEVLEKSSEWGNSEQIMYVVGATKASSLTSIRKIVPDNFLLIPGVGAQGGNLEEVTQFGINKTVGLIVNASRSIIYASDGMDFDQAARLKSLEIQSEMEALMDKYY